MTTSRLVTPARSSLSLPPVEPAMPRKLKHRGKPLLFLDPLSPDLFRFHVSLPFLLPSDLMNSPPPPPPPPPPPYGLLQAPDPPSIFPPSQYNVTWWFSLRGLNGVLLVFFPLSYEISFLIEFFSIGSTRGCPISRVPFSSLPLFLPGSLCRGFYPVRAQRRIAFRRSVIFLLLT